MRIFCRTLIRKTSRMNIQITANATSADRPDFGRSILGVRPRRIAIQALCMAIVLLDLLGAIMGLSDFVVAFWTHHPFLAIPCTAAAILSFAAVIEYGITRLRADAA
jgi:hypothetical protein